MQKNGMNTSRWKSSIFINGSSYLTSINRFEGNSDCEADSEF